MEKIHLYDKILSPVVTEKATNLSELNKIVFKVPDGATKKNLKKNIEKIFKVNVTKINIINKLIQYHFRHAIFDRGFHMCGKLGNSKLPLKYLE